MLNSAKLLCWNFRYHSEFSLCIAKITVHRENFYVLFLCSNDSILVFLLSALVITFVLVFFFVISLALHTI